MRTEAAGAFSLAIVCLLLASVCLAALDSQEYDALVDLYNATDGPNWTYNTNWLNGDPCTTEWFGVTCTSSGSNVLKIELMDNGLNGTIPASTGSYASLTILRLDSNSLQGSIPETLGSLPSVQYLYLYQNNLTGTIPSTFGTASIEMVNLLLDHNQLSGTIPASIGYFSSTKFNDLRLNENQLSGTIPDQLGNLGSMTILQLDSNLLSGDVPASIGDISRLQTLNLSCNHFSGALPPFLQSNPGYTAEVSMNCFTCPLPTWCADSACKNTAECHGNCSVAFSITSTVSDTPSVTPTNTPTSSLSPTCTPSSSRTATNSRTRSTTPTRSYSMSRTATTSWTASMSPSVTPSASLPCGVCDHGDCVDTTCICRWGWSGDTCSKESTMEPIANTLVPTTAVLLLVTALLLPFGPEWAVMVRGDSIGTLPSYLIVVLLVYMQHIAIGGLYPGSLSQNFYLWTQLFSWCILLTPYQLTFPWEPVDDQTPSGRVLLGVEDVSVITGVPVSEMFAGALFWFTVIAVVFVPLTAAIVATLRTAALRMARHKQDISEEMPLLVGDDNVRIQGVADHTEDEDVTSEQPPDQPVASTSSYRELFREDSTTLSHWFLMNIGCDCVRMLFALVAIFYFPLMTFTAMEISQLWAGSDLDLTAGDYMQVVLGCLLFLLIGLGLPILLVFVAREVKQQGDTPWYLELTIVPLVVHLKSPKAYMATVFLCFSLLSSVMIACLPNDPEVFYFLSLTAHCIAVVVLLYVRPYQDRSRFVLEAAMSAVLVARLLLLFLVEEDVIQGSGSSATLGTIVALDSVFLLCCWTASVFRPLQWWMVRIREKYRRIRLQYYLPDQGSMDMLLRVRRNSLSFRDLLENSGLRVIPWCDIQVKDRIGRGASGVVFAATWTNNRNEREVALKELVMAEDHVVMRAFLKEVAMISALRHENILGFMGVSFDQDRLFLVTELMEYGSLRDVLTKSNGALSFSLRIKLAIDIANGLRYMHANKLIHRDVKPHNLLVNSEWVCKVADFGVSTWKTSSRTMTAVGTPVFMAPELLNADRYGEKADVYSLGLVFCELFTDKKPYEELNSLNQVQLLYKVFHEGIRPSLEGLPESLCILIQHMLEHESADRPSLEVVIDTLQQFQRLKRSPSMRRRSVRDSISLE